MASSGGVAYARKKGIFGGQKAFGRGYASDSIFRKEDTMSKQDVSRETWLTKDRILLARVSCRLELEIYLQNLHFSFSFSVCSNCLSASKVLSLSSVGFSLR
jgi:hypothetical protein